MSIPVYVISLPVSHQRREKFCHRAAHIHLQFSFFNATYGENNPVCRRIFYNQNPQSRFKRLLSLPEIGCYISHINLWKKIAASSSLGAIILEDDADFKEGFSALILHLSKCDISNVIIKFDALRRKPKKTDYLCKVPGNFNIIQPRILSSRTTGYFIGKKAATDLLNIRRNIYRPIDMDMKHWWEHNIPSLVTEPGAVYEAINTNDSSIEKSRLLSKSTFFPFYRNMRYQWNLHYNAWRKDLPVVSPAIFSHYSSSS
ncbi:glycosyltransferase family 25 protein [Candidatus Liberibacter africanus]|uniref:Glycosyl transferase family protein n=1 Tax=Candidatus Liberibacter africanus PTSAPSY TaxID=1277257 RepID=A0A0G3I7W3_LIBAF|nr:glycosyltransferase family 25 protein [Candidatus Liberibacter africanus]AKK20653.1 glycosyl transferase family protein [Candidatus Liberibacter africanus PTSAPSY]QTP64328.1 glycosyltransferase family 25 protein [Candidatus Liberibacter africanus]